MIVEIYGGPLDGQFQEVADGAHELCFVTAPELPTVLAAAEPELAPPEFRRTVLPIRRRRSDGMMVAVWPYQ